MDRRACLDVPALALQLLVAAHPDWKKLPVAVVDRDEPTGTLLEVNERAWRSRLRPGMRYAAALSLDGRLRAGVVAAAEIEDATRRITETLRRFTPHVEPSREEPGVFWLDAGGLELLYANAEAWARAVGRAVTALGFDVRLVAAFTRFGSYALAKALSGAPSPRGRGPRRLLVCESEQEERRLLREVPLERLGIAPRLRDSLSRLGVTSIGDFQRLPAEGIRRRFGAEAEHLHRRARGEAWDPLVPLAPEEPLARSLILDDPVADSGIVLFLVRGLLAGLLAVLAAREQGVAAVTLRLHRSLKRDSPPLDFTVRAAVATLEEAVLLDLVRLRLDAELRHALAGSSVIEIEVEVEAAAAGREQLRLFHERTRRDLAAGARALARLRAELGEDAVVRAVLREGHLPEAGFSWEKADTLPAPSPRVVLLKPLVRRLYERPIALPPKPFRERDDCWIPSVLYESGPQRGIRHVETGTGRSLSSSMRPASGELGPGAQNPQRGAEDSAGRPRKAPPAGRVVRSAAHGRVDNMSGPYIVSGGWWNREVHREYHFARTEDGDILWVYYDRFRRRWFLAGKVE